MLMSFSSELIAYILLNRDEYLTSIFASYQINTNPAAAEATILSLHQSPQPYKACRFILGKIRESDSLSEFEVTAV